MLFEFLKILFVFILLSLSLQFLVFEDFLFLLFHDFVEPLINGSVGSFRSQKFGALIN